MNKIKFKFSEGDKETWLAPRCHFGSIGK